MKRFEFSLDRVLKVKRQLERVAEMEQLRARAAADAAHAALADRRRELARSADRLAASVGSALTPLQWATAATAAERLSQLLREAEAAATTADAKLAAAIDARAKIAKDVEALATLRQEHWDEWTREARVATQTQLDEVGLRRWMAARADALTGRADT